MKKEFKAVICVVLALWLFFIGFEVGSIREKALINAELAASAAQTTVEIQTQATEATAATTLAETTLAETTEAQTDVLQQETTASDTVDASSSAETTAVQGTDVTSLSKEEILQIVTNSINNLRAEQNFTANKTENVTIQLTDLSVSRAKDLINSIIQKLAGESTASYTFVNGIGSGTDDGDAVENVTVAQVIPPENGFTLTADGVASAKAEKTGTDTIYTLTLVEENTTFTEPIPTYNSAAFSYLDLTAVDISGATITDANMHYPGTTITVTVNETGKITNLHFNMPMDGNGTAKITFFSGSATFEGSDDEVWEITY